MTTLTLALCWYRFSLSAAATATYSISSALVLAWTRGGCMYSFLSASLRDAHRGSSLVSSLEGTATDHVKAAGTEDVGDRQIRRHIQAIRPRVPVAAQQMLAEGPGDEVDERLEDPLRGKIQGGFVAHPHRVDGDDLVVTFQVLPYVVRTLVAVAELRHRDGGFVPLQRDRASLHHPGDGIGAVEGEGPDQGVHAHGVDHGVHHRDVCCARSSLRTSPRGQAGRWRPI